MARRGTFRRERANIPPNGRSVTVAARGRQVVIIPIGVGIRAVDLEVRLKGLLLVVIEVHAAETRDQIVVKLPVGIQQILLVIGAGIPRGCLAVQLGQALGILPAIAIAGHHRHEDALRGIHIMVQRVVAVAMDEREGDALFALRSRALSWSGNREGTRRRSVSVKRGQETAGTVGKEDRPAGGRENQGRTMVTVGLERRGRGGKGRNRQQGR